MATKKNVSSKQFQEVMLRSYLSALRTSDGKTVEFGDLQVKN